jgi:altronate dehydratase large subunit
LHSKGCGQLKPDLRIITRTLIGLGINPNVGGVLLVGLGCEAVDIEEVYAALSGRGRMVEKVIIHREGGMDRTVRAGRERVGQMLERVLKEERIPQGMENIRLGG